MRNLTTEVNDPDAPQVLAEPEVLTSPCPRCAKDVTREIPAGTTLAVAAMMRKVVLTCTSCAEAEEAEQAEEEARRLRAQRLSASGLPPMLRGLTFESYDTGRKGAAGAKAAAEAWARGEHEKRGLLLLGPVGVGKTRLAATAAWAALDRIGVRYVNVAELIVKLSAAFGDKDRAAALKILTGRTPLVLDDLDKVNPSMHVLAHLYTAIDGRVQAGVPLIVTTNLRPSQLLEKFAAVKGSEDAEERRTAAAAIVSRLRGHCTLHLIEGKDGRDA